MRDLRLTILGHLKAFFGARVCLDFRHCYILLSFIDGFVAIYSDFSAGASPFGACCFWGFLPFFGGFALLAAMNMSI